MTRQLLAIIFTALAWSRACADTARPIHLKDRLGEFHLVVAGALENVDVVESKDAQGGQQFVAIGHVLVTETLKGQMPTKGAELLVALAPPTPLRVVAEEYLRSHNRDMEIWMLRETDGTLPVAHIVAFRSRPDRPDNWEPYLAAFRASATSFRGMSSLRMTLSFDQSTMVKGTTYEALVKLTSKEPQSAELPDGLTWGKNIVFVLQEARAGTFIGRRRPATALPLLMVTRAASGSEDGIPTEIFSGAGTEARVFVLPDNMRSVVEDLTLTCYARVIDNAGSTIVQSNPVTLHFPKVRSGKAAGR